MKRIYHPWDKWECYRAGFFEATHPRGISEEEAMEEYAEFLSDTPRFEAALERVIQEWKHSCEQFLSNQSMNRIAWLGQAAMCIDTGVPSRFRAGFRLLSPEEQEKANETAEKFLKKWLKKYSNT